MSPRKLATDPVILEMPAQKMAALKGVGAPDKVFADLMPALYGSVYTLKFARKKAGLPDFKVGACRARYPDAHLKPKDQWTIIMGLPIPEDVASLPQKVPCIEVRIETWQYGTVGQILHIGGYDQETPTVQRLQKFIMDNGYEVAGAHEEEYLTKPDAKVVKTIIRYPVKKK